ncbi:MAG: hypothetical protein K0Q59_2151 [Paenibacillus sp.]|jgi:hypothetical protein|nr:hypothetical protein [Paenibacillus sp.]
MPFRNLLVKEVKGIFPLFAVFALLVVVIDLLVMAKSIYVKKETIVIITTLTPFLFISFIALGVGYYQLFTEWRTNSIYLLLSLPMRGWKLLTAKLVALLGLLLLTLLWIALSFCLIILRTVWSDVDADNIVPMLLNLGMYAFVIYVLLVVFVLSALQFAFLCGQFVSRLRWLVVLGVFFAVMWLYARVSPVISGWLLWLPDFNLGSLETDMVYLHSGPYVVMLLAIVGLVGLSGYLFEKEVEV